MTNAIIFIENDALYASNDLIVRTKKSGHLLSEPYITKISCLLRIYCKNKL